MLAVSYCRERSDGCDQRGLAEDLPLQVLLSAFFAHIKIMFDIEKYESLLFFALQMWIRHLNPDCKHFFAAEVGSDDFWGPAQNSPSVHD